MSIMAAYSLRGAAAQTFYTALQQAGFSKLYPGDSCILTMAPDSSLSSLSYLSRMQNWYHARKDDSVISVQKDPLEVTVSRNLLNGTLETSLFDAMQERGTGPAIVCALADIFAWDINFFIDPRKGDSFQIIFEEKHALGRTIGYGDILAARYTCNGRDYFAIAFPDSTGKLLYYDLTGKSVQKEFLKAPLRFSRVSSSFSYRRRHPVLGIVRPHLAIDYAAPRGTPVQAAADGVIRSAGWNGGYGNLVIIGHGGSYSTCYGHLSRITPGIRAGTRVRQGDIIGTVGSTGLSSGPHLDYRMLNGTCPVNPLTINLPSKSGILDSERAEFNRVMASYQLEFRYRFAGSDGRFFLEVHTDPAGRPQTPPPDSSHGT